MTIKTKRPARSKVVSFRVTPQEWRSVEAKRQPDELSSECARRLLLKALKGK